MRRSTPHAPPPSDSSAALIPAPKAWLTGSALAVLAATLAACGTTSQYAPREGYTAPAAREPLRPNFPITQAPAPAEPLADAPTATAPGAAGQADAPMARPSGTVTSQPLAPPIQSQEPPPPPPPPPQTSYVAPQPAAPATTTTTTTVTSVNGRVVDVSGKPQVYVIKSGDTLAGIARRMGVTQKALADSNSLEPPYMLRPGRTLKGPASRPAKAYVVGQGDTLYAIARRFGVSAAAIAETNDIEIGNVRAGQRLELPEGFKDSGPLRTTVTRTVPAAPSQTFAAQTPPAPAYVPPTPAAIPAAAPQTATVSTEVSVSGRVVDVAGKPTSYKVKSGDTLIGLADRLNTTQKQLIEDNDLSSPYRLRIGQTLKGPATRAKAYVVGQGDTLGGVAQRFSVTTSALASANGIRTSSALRAGQRITLPSNYRDRGPIRTTTTTQAANTATPVASPPRVAAATPTTPQPYSPPAYTPARPAPPPMAANAPTRLPPAPAAALPTATPALSDSEIAAAGRGRFTWPVRGPVISSYGPTGAGQRNDGLNLRASAGEPVRSAAAGEVVYAGDVVPGFGNLVLIKHDGGWVTAYGHLSRSDVRMQQQVAQGQQIGQVGSSGGVPEPQLHFEVRYAPTAKDRARPIDPALVLPQ